MHEVNGSCHARSFLYIYQADCSQHAGLDKAIGCFESDSSEGNSDVSIHAHNSAIKQLEHGAVFQHCRNI
jgi:hypothetical protein